MTSAKRWRKRAGSLCRVRCSSGQLQKFLSASHRLPIRGAALAGLGPPVLANGAQQVRRRRHDERRLRDVALVLWVVAVPGG
eukprot:5311222-Pleurochrysis_carterae.AAC.1